MSNALKLAFAGTPPFAAEQLNALIKAGYEVAIVYTQPDRPKGRGQKLQPSPVKEIALAHNIPVFQPQTLKAQAAISPLADAKIDLLIVSAYGLILPAKVLSIPKYGCWNVHASLLPKYRGAAPIQYAILSGEAETGVTLMQMDEGMDTGDMLLSAQTPILANDTATTMHDKLAQLGAQLLLQGLQDINTTIEQRSPQDSAQATYAPKIQKAQAQLDFSKPAEHLERLIRAYTPWPVAFFVHNDANIKVHKASVRPCENKATPGTIISVAPSGLSVACGAGALHIEALQLPSKKALSFKDFYNAHPDYFTTGMILN